MKREAHIKEKEGSRRILVAETKKRLHGSDVGSEGAWRVGRLQEAEVWVGAAGRTLRAVTGRKHMV